MFMFCSYGFLLLAFLSRETKSYVDSNTYDSGIAEHFPCGGGGDNVRYLRPGPNIACKYDVRGRKARQRAPEIMPAVQTVAYEKADDDRRTRRTPQKVGERGSLLQKNGRDPRETADIADPLRKRTGGDQRGLIPGRAMRNEDDMRISR